MAYASRVADSGAFGSPPESRILPWPRLDPRRADRQRARCAATAQASLGVRKRAALKLGRSVDVIDLECRGHTSSRIYRHDELIFAAAEPFRLAAHAQVTAMQSSFEGRSAAELVAQWWEITDREHSLEAEQNRATFVADAETAALADEAHAAVLMERAALFRYLRDRHGIDPRKHRR